MAGLDLPQNKVLLINTVHDDIELDIDNNPELLYTICITLENVFTDLPANFEKQFGVAFDVPLMGEVFYGHNLAEMTQFNRELGQQQYESNNRNS